MGVVFQESVGHHGIAYHQPIIKVPLDVVELRSSSQSVILLIISWTVSARKVLSWMRLRIVALLVCFLISDFEVRQLDGIFLLSLLAIQPEYIGKRTLVGTYRYLLLTLTWLTGTRTRWRPIRYHINIGSIHHLNRYAFRIDNLGGRWRRLLVAIIIPIRNRLLY